jgi:quinol monooxygenase YgiN
VRVLSVAARSLAHHTIHTAIDLASADEPGTRTGRGEAARPTPVHGEAEHGRYATGRAGIMSTVALFVRLVARPGKEALVEACIRDALRLAQDDPTRAAWFALRTGPSTFGIFDVFPDASSLEDHLPGEIAAALMARTFDLLAESPTIEKMDVLAAKFLLVNFSRRERQTDCHL